MLPLLSLLALLLSNIVPCKRLFCLNVFRKSRPKGLKGRQEPAGNKTCLSNWNRNPLR